MNQARAVDVQVQTVIYNLAPDRVARSLRFLDNAVSVARKSGVIGRVRLCYGDCSPTRSLTDSDLGELRNFAENIGSIHYEFFNENLGSAAGHNRLLAGADATFVMIMNPDVLAAPDLFDRLFEGLCSADIGLVEARQMPIEHPKYYDALTGETSWASTACAVAPLEIFRQLQGFDSETFFLYCDDVDFSWRLRLAGFRIIYRYSAVVYHDKRLNLEGGWIAGDAERYYSAEAALLLPYKYSRADLVEKNLRYFQGSGDAFMLKAAASFQQRRKAGRLPIQVDSDHKVAEFIDGNYGRHRF